MATNRCNTKTNTTLSITSPRPSDNVRMPIINSVTLAAHARRGLITQVTEQAKAAA